MTAPRTRRVGITEEELARRVDVAAARYGPNIRRIVRAAMDELAASGDPAAMEAALLYGDPALVERVYRWDRIARGFGALADDGGEPGPVVRMFDAGVALGVNTMPAPVATAIPSPADLARTPAARAAVRDELAHLVRDVAAETKRGIAQVVVDFYRAGRQGTGLGGGGIAQRDIRAVLTARETTGLVGLTRPQSRVLTRYADGLLQDGELPAGRIQKLVARKRDELLAVRARVISNTEGARAARAGQTHAWGEAVKRGQVDRGDWVQEWVTRLVNSCPECEALDGQLAEIGEGFTGGVGGPPDPHPGCQCFVRLVPRRAEIAA